MKKIIYIGLLAITGLFLSQCTTDLQDNTEGAQEGGLISSNNNSLNYVVGNDGTYSFDMLVQQNADFPVSQVNLYKKAQINVDGENKLSNEILSESIDVGGVVSTSIKSKEYAYADLIDGLTIDGTPLPASDGNLTIGDKFIFRIESVLSNGNKFEQSFTANMTVSTRFAGRYLVLEGEYFRLGANNGGGTMWVGGEVIISSVDAQTYKFEEWGAISGWTGNVLYFQIDPSTSEIIYPAEWDGVAQTLNGEPLMTPQTHASDMTSVIPIAGADINTAIKDDAEGKDRLNMCHGYYTGGSGPREFYFLLEKIVN